MSIGHRYLVGYIEFSKHTGLIKYTSRRFVYCSENWSAILNHLNLPHLAAWRNIFNGSAEITGH